MASRKSVVLVTVDCLRADHCSFLGYGLPTTPFLNGLARESFVFPAAIVAGVPTYYSVPAILASRYPLAFGREVVGLAGEQNIASALKGTGHTTAFFGAGNPYLSPRFGYDFGFDTFRDFLDESPTTEPVASLRTEIGWARRLNRKLDEISHRLGPLGAAYDELYFQYCQRWAAPPAGTIDGLRRFPAADVIVDEARTWLASMGERPFFLWLHLMDPHSPYYPGTKSQELFRGEATTLARARYLNAYWNRSDLGPGRLRRYRDEVVALHDAGIRWVDEQIARLIEAIRGSHFWENCIFALTADHGEEFLEHEGRYHAPTGLAEELIRVPLLLRVPGIQKKELSDAPFSLLDLAPTLLDAAELPVPREFQGQSRWTEIQQGRAWDAPAIAECISTCSNPFRADKRRGPRILAVREARYKLVLDFASSAEQLFDLKADPGERAPLPDNLCQRERGHLLQAVLEHLKMRRPYESGGSLRARLRDIEFDLARVVSGANSGGPVKVGTRNAV